MLISGCLHSVCFHICQDQTCDACLNFVLHFSVHTNTTQIRRSKALWMKIKTTWISIKLGFLLLFFFRKTKLKFSFLVQAICTQSELNKFLQQRRKNERAEKKKGSRTLWHKESCSIWSSSVGQVKSWLKKPGSFFCLFLHCIIKLNYRMDLKAYCLK